MKWDTTDLADHPLVYLSALLYAVFGGCVVMRRAVPSFYVWAFGRGADKDKSARPGFQLSSIHGMVERAVYAVSLVVDPRFIVVWLGIEVAGEWNHWHKNSAGRSGYLIFLIGKCLSLLFAFTAWGFVRLWTDGHWVEALCILIGHAIFMTILAVYSSSQCRTVHREQPARAEPPGPRLQRP